jgi:hypothetical protein
MATSQANAGRQQAQTAVQSARNTNVGASDLPEGWSAGKAGDGRTYYMDSINKRTQWEHPGAAQNTDDSTKEEERLARIARQKEEEEKRAAISAVAEREAKERREAEEVAKAVAAVAAAEAKAAREQAAQAAAIEEKRLAEQRRIMALAANGDGDADALPSGWTAKRAPDGRTYYENHATKSTSWVKPSAAHARGPSQVPLSQFLKILLPSWPWLPSLYCLIVNSEHNISGCGGFDHHARLPEWLGAQVAAGGWGTAAVLHQSCQQGDFLGGP